MYSAQRFQNQWLPAAVLGLTLVISQAGQLQQNDFDGTDFQKKIQPILTEYCSDCHADGMNKGNIALDEFKSHQQMLADKKLWLGVLKNVRAGLMPPEKKEKPSEEEKQALEQWIKRTVFQLDPAQPDPGRVTLRRLNRVEYRNTIRELMDYDFKAFEEFPPDDTGYGFDNIGDVLTVSPLLLEKYVQAAETIVGKAVPLQPRVVKERVVPGREIKATEGEGNAERFRFKRAVTFTKQFKVEQSGRYRVTLDAIVDGSFDFDTAKALVRYSVDGKERFAREFKWEENLKVPDQFEVDWEAGEHTLMLQVEPLAESTKEHTFVEFRVGSVNVQGPLDPKFWSATRNYDRFFTRAEPPVELEQQHAYAREVLHRFAEKAFRRPVDERTVERLQKLAAEIYTQPGKRFEEGISRAMVAVLASPRFLFRTEEPLNGEAAVSEVDEYALASRLSYFIWSTMPDNELLELARKGELRKNLPGQLKRMLADRRSEEMVENFTGQWLQIRDVEGVAINPRVVLRREGVRERFEFDHDLRTAMRRETEMYFGHIVKEDRSVLELLSSDYTFLNERLAKHYKIEGVQGHEMRKVQLPPENPRGGVLTHGAVLAVTSNPTRTSPVKRGLFVLENIMGTPTPPPPPDVPELEEAGKEFKDREPTLREMLELHRSQPLCRSCHNRMDPLGLALENFNALGMYREMERNAAIDTTGQLATGEQFTSIRDLKLILASDRKTDFYRCLTEKFLTYALGRGLEYYDVETVDQIVARLEKGGGKFSELMAGVIESAPFQKRRNVSGVNTAAVTNNQ
ncbi:MAG: DUF1592 domain-containing protein [Verrucomicrobiota bacterium]|nr:DUF1592 domain-containing protein [Verrucomicrobiota bacterium]